MARPAALQLRASCHWGAGVEAKLQPSGEAGGQRCLSHRPWSSRECAWNMDGYMGSWILDDVMLGCLGDFGDLDDVILGCLMDLGDFLT